MIWTQSNSKYNLSKLYTHTQSDIHVHTYSYDNLIIILHNQQFCLIFYLVGNLQLQLRILKIFRTHLKNTWMNFQNIQFHEHVDNHHKYLQFRNIFLVSPLRSQQLTPDTTNCRIVAKFVFNFSNKLFKLCDISTIRNKKLHLCKD